MVPDKTVEVAWQILYYIRSQFNILETSAAMKLNAFMARLGGDVRFTNFVDSHVAKSVLTRCRSS